jgi:uncharacterized protein
MDDYFRSVFEAPMTRRRLIKAVAVAGAATWAAGTLPGLAKADGRRSRFGEFVAIGPSAADELQVPDGYVTDVLLKWGEEFAPGMKFGYNCDYSALFPLRRRSDDGFHGSDDDDDDDDDGGGRGGFDGLVWVNHEYVIPLFTSNWRMADDGSWDPRNNPVHHALMELEKSEVGGSIVHVRRRGRGPWEVVYGSRFSRRFTGAGPAVPYDGPVAGTNLVPSDGTVLGTLANCSGATTPWGTVLSCEENYQSYGLKRAMPFALGWYKGAGQTEEEVNYYIGEPGRNINDQQVQDQWPFYGYVAEIDPFSGEAVKHTALGRIHHENVAIHVSRDGRVVCYTGDDAPAADGMFFKFVSRRRLRGRMSRSDAMKILSEGQLYVAQWLPTANDAAVDSGTGRWHPLNMSNPEALAFTTKWIEQNVVPSAGGDISQFRVPRAEDCEIHPRNHRDVLISLTSAKGRPADAFAYGVVRLLREDRQNADSRTFRWVELLEGGEHTGFASPDNMGFLSKDELLVVTDISSSSLNRPDRGFAWHMNNAIFYVPLRGPNANVAFRFANAPVSAELTGPTFVRGQDTLFVNVQHPGETTSTNANPHNPLEFTSWWPEGNRTAGTGPGKPKPSLVAIRKVR